MAIGEFSDRSGLSAKRLRTYAAEGLLAPAAVDPGSGYRYYSPGQLADAKVIDALRQAGVPLADIRAFMRLPSEERLDAWARQLDSDANHRQGALTLARHLLTEKEDPSFPTANPDFKERFMTTLRTAGRTDIGQLRENNEDVIVSSDRLALVADGMGGHPGGEIAANVAAGVIPAVFIGPIRGRARSGGTSSELGDPGPRGRSVRIRGHGHHDLCGWSSRVRTARTRQCRRQPRLSLA